MTSGLIWFLIVYGTYGLGLAVDLCLKMTIHYTISRYCWGHVWLTFVLLAWFGSGWMGLAYHLFVPAMTGVRPQ